MIERHKLSHARGGHPMQMGGGGCWGVEKKLLLCLLLLLLEMCREGYAAVIKKR